MIHFAESGFFKLLFDNDCGYLPLVSININKNCNQDYDNNQQENQE
jgi:hypothetical protein